MNALSYFKLMLIKHSNHIINALVRFSLSKLLRSKQGFFLFAGDRNPPQSGLCKEGISIVSHKWKVQGDILVSGMAWLWRELILSGNGYLFVLLTCLASFSVSALSLRWRSASSISCPQRLAIPPITGAISALGLANPGTNAHPNI